MSKNILPPITQDNFSEVWEIVDRKRRIAKKKRVTMLFATFFSNMLFAALALFIGNGLLYDNITGDYVKVLELIPQFIDAWVKYKAMVFKAGEPAVMQALISIGLVYLVTFLVCGVGVLIMTILYHPLHKKIPTGTPKEQANWLLSSATEARSYARRTTQSGSALWAFFFMLGVFGCMALYMSYLGDYDKVMGITETNEIRKILQQDAIGKFKLYATPFAIYMVYAAFNWIHALSTRFMYKYNVPYGFVAETEYYYVFVDEITEHKHFDDIQAERRANAESIRIQALDMERIGAYGKAKELFAQAAHSGDAAAMENYARHFLIHLQKEPARYWLQRCVDTGNASPEAIRNLRKMKWHLKVKGSYLK